LLRLNISGLFTVAIATSLPKSDSTTTPASVVVAPAATGASAAAG